ncbi:D-alanyl-D-alanine carboxypeptidase family protein [Dokdonia sinensis]|uniref:D-alanyl-D-alanine carboxypeptidase family protein n=1 Tax=Dokdonia sinensis TaxID=2479847 RepID=A0A3M0FTX2_9FLAO|nr:M15 family metallopeptidase [Dokdonia sinensis]RMB56101.1 D-alanyl-D-alanine carboxypeptidase family protein [Dokdonia sinensis]
MKLKSNIAPTLLLLFIVCALNAQTIISEEELLGKGNPDMTSGDGYRLRPEAAQAFELLKTAALKDGISIKVVSSYRDYDHQNRIWERKYKRFRESGLTPLKSIEKIIEYSTIPGTSRHHWGTDIDLIDSTPKVKGDVLVPSKFHGTGPFCKFKEWMDAHANEYGFYLVYTDAINRKGFKYEPWHYSYKPLSQEYLKEYKKLDIQVRLGAAQLMGAGYFTKDFINRYRTENIMDINPALLD